MGKYIYVVQNSPGEAGAMVHSVNTFVSRGSEFNPDVKSKQVMPGSGGTLL